VSNIVRFAPLWVDKKCLSVGAGRARMWFTPEEDWTTLDMDPSTEPDVVGNVCDMSTFRDESFDFVLASHVLEHIHDPFPAVSEIWRVLRPGGRLLAVVPHALSFGYLSPPHHTRPFMPDTFVYFTPQVYEKEGTHGTGAYECRRVHPWVIETLEVSTVPEWQWVLRWFPSVHAVLSRHLFDILQDIYVVMRKP
jgi:SAM-dependent methyltransferase